nr:TlpA disulfide reductase family protein [uncultured Allomuricauda sp.]
MVKMSFFKKKLIYVFTLIALSSCLSGQKIKKIIDYQDLKRSDGTSISAETLKNKILVVNFWATWCKPCINEIPDLNQLVIDHQDKENVLFMAIATSERENHSKLPNFLNRVPFMFEQLAPESGAIFCEDTDELRYPTTLVFDKSGMLQKKFVGTLSKKELRTIDSFCQSH